MKKLFALALVAFAVAACDAGIASSTTVQGPAASGASPAACPTMSGQAGAMKSGGCGECPAEMEEVKDCSGGACEAPAMDCDEPCDEPCEVKCEEKKDCSSKKECAPKAGN